MAELIPPVLGLQPGDSPEKAIGLDVPRLWANGVQITLAGNDAFVVFREQISLQDAEGAEPRLIFRNVASLLMPMSGLIATRDLLNRLIPPEDSGDEAA